MKRAVVIVWYDACGQTGWQGSEEAIEVANAPESPVFTYGVLIKATKEWLTIFQSDGGDQLHNYLKIPRKWIAEILEIPSLEVLREMQPQKRRKR